MNLEKQLQHQHTYQLLYICMHTQIQSKIKYI